MRLTRLPLALTLALATVIVVHAHAPFSLDSSFLAVDSEGRSAAIVDDGLGLYQDLVDGVESYSNDYGNITLDTSLSSRRICMDFGEVVQDWRSDLPRPAAGLACHNAAITTRANAEGGVTDVVIGAPLDKGMQIHWTGPAARGGTADFMLAFGYHTLLPYEADRLLVTCTAGAEDVCDEWTLEPFIALEVEGDQRPRDDNGSIIGPLGRVFVFETLKGRKSQLTAVAEYVMPMRMVIARADENKRTSKPKGRK
jgi:hypothetical protein